MTDHIQISQAFSSVVHFPFQDPIQDSMFYFVDMLSQSLSLLVCDLDSFDDCWSVVLECHTYWAVWVYRCFLMNRDQWYSLFSWPEYHKRDTCVLVSTCIRGWCIIVNIIYCLWFSSRSFKMVSSKSLVILTPYPWI